MDRLKALLFSAAQAVWVVLRAAGRTLLGAQRFDRLVARTGLRELKARHWLARRALPDGSRLWHRPHDQCVIDEVSVGGVYALDDLRPGGTVVDVGAHIGTLAVLAARRVGPSGRVIAFEPSPDTRALLRRNVEGNGLAWVVVREEACAEAAGEAELFAAEGGTENPAADTLNPTPGRRAVRVRLRRLDDVLAEERVEAIDLLKIDVEGAELRVMDGAPRALARARRIAMEVHPPRVDPAEVRRRLEALGFSCRVVAEGPGSAILEAVRAG